MYFLEASYSLKNENLMVYVVVPEMSYLSLSPYFVYNPQGHCLLTDKYNYIIYYYVYHLIIFFSVIPLVLFT